MASFRYAVGDRLEAVGSPVASWVVAVGRCAVKETLPNGQVFHMTYKTERGAHKALARVKVELPTAHVAYHPGRWA